MERKGQAAMEFLMTYGWAILAAIIVIGVLAIYFRPSTLVSTQAVVTAPWYVEGYNIVAGSGANLQFKNNGGEQYTVTEVQILNAKLNNAAVTCVADSTDDLVEAGELTRQYAVTGCVGVAADAGKTFSGDLVVKYVRGTDVTALGLQSTGSISGKLT